MRHNVKKDLLALNLRADLAMNIMEWGEEALLLLLCSFPPFK